MHSQPVQRGVRQTRQSFQVMTPQTHLQANEALSSARRLREIPKGNHSSKSQVQLSVFLRGGKPT